MGSSNRLFFVYSRGVCPLQTEEFLCQLAAIEATYANRRQIVEWRVKTADIVNYFYQVVDVDDTFLVDLHKLRV